MTAASIGAHAASGYADYLRSRTVVPQQGDYYLGRDGSPAESAGRWITSPAALERLGIAPGEVAPGDLRALMEGRAPTSTGDDPVWLRPAGPDGTRAAGLDVTFSPPKPVSVVWATATAVARDEIEQAHSRAVAAAIAHLRETVQLTHEPGVGAAWAAELHAAEFVHTTARGVAGSVPDPQLHSHVVIPSVERREGSIAAVRSRPAFAAAREVGAYYRAHLAESLRDLGYQIEPAGTEGRYFTIRGVGEDVSRAFSKRTEEVHRAAQRFRAEHGRDPERGALRSLAVSSREAKLPRTRAELDHAWRRVAVEHGMAQPPDLIGPGTRVAQTDEWPGRVVRAATAKRATFDRRELRAVALEQAVGAGYGPEHALVRADELRTAGTVLELRDGRLTTARMRSLERMVQESFKRLAETRSRSIPASARDAAITRVEERIAGPLTAEQRAAVETLAGPEHAAVLIGPAGTGKGVVVDATARAELAVGREPIGVAVAGRTAQRLGEDSPALAERVRTLDSLVAGSPDLSPLGPAVTVYLDEAGMGDTDRLARLVDAVQRSGAALVLIGDSRQLPSVGAGGMFERLRTAAPAAELATVVRTADRSERAAWRALRQGDPGAAMAHYRSRGALHFSESRVEAVDQAARRYVDLAANHGASAVALMTDASNAEVDALNLRVQQLRLTAGQLGAAAIELPTGGHEVHPGDRVTWSRPMRTASGPRVENGARGDALCVEGGALTVRLDGSGRQVVAEREDADALRLGYAGHVYRQQGATVLRAVVVTGGWQTSREGAYVEASRAREGCEWHVAREELEGADDAERVDQLAARMRIVASQTPSIAVPLADDRLDLVPAPGLEPVSVNATVEVEH